MTTRLTAIFVTVAVLGLLFGRYSAPATNEAGLIKLIALQAEEIEVLKAIVATYKAAYGEP